MPAPSREARGRRPGHPETRAAILDAARALIAQQGCGSTTLRAIARQAGVDSALVVHYFTNRRGLLRAALRPENPIDVDFAHILTDGEPDQRGQRLVLSFLEQLEAPDAQPTLVLRVIGMGLDDDLAGELLRELIVERFIEPLASALAQTADLSADPRLAAELAATQLLALLLSGAVPAFDQIANQSRSELVRHYGTLVQTALTTSS